MGVGGQHHASGSFGGLEDACYIIALNNLIAQPPITKTIGFRTDDK
jgi:hypothetical protein